MVTHLRIGTRKSPLALAQAGQVRTMIEQAYPALAGKVELVEFVTSGDRFRGPLTEVGGKGLFTKEIEEALLAGQIDLAVHSLKDMSTVLPDGLAIACTPAREDPRDALIGEGLQSLHDLPVGAIVGTSSLRRAALVKLARADVAVVSLRGNVATRIEKLSRGEVQATLLAMAGLKRLGIVQQVPHVALEPEAFLPAIGQGILALECRRDDKAVWPMLAALSHMPTQRAAECERAFLRALDGSCRTPIAGYAQVDEGGRLFFCGLVAAPDGSAKEEIQGSISADDAEALGRQLGETLRGRPGVAQILGCFTRL